MLALTALTRLQAAESGDFGYEQTGQEITITHYTGNGGDVAIPEKIAGLPVTAIGNAAFISHDGLTSVTIPDNVISIDNNAFSYCRNLTTVTMPASRVSFGVYVFMECTALTRFDVGPQNPFYDALDGVLLSEGQPEVALVLYPPGRAGSYTVPDQVTRIANHAFDQCFGLSAVTIPDGVPLIGEYAFSECYGLTNVILGNGLQDIGNRAFHLCRNLTSVTIPSSVTRIGNGAFESTGLTEVAVPDNVTSIGYSAFSDCIKLVSAALPDTATSLGYGVFSGCRSLTVVTMPEDLTRIEHNTFAGCESLASVTIPVNVTSIERSAFSACTNLSTVKLPSGLTSIGEGAFDRCYSLNRLTIPDSVTIIGDRALRRCTSLMRVYFEGDAPDAGSNPFLDSPTVSHYFVEAASWAPTFGGRPTEIWPALEIYPRPDELTAEDKIPLEETHHALYLSSAPEKSYEVQSADLVTGPWHTETVVTVTTTQKRLVFDKPTSKAFYRVVLSP